MIARVEVMETWVENTRPVTHFLFNSTIVITEKY